VRHPLQVVEDVVQVGGEGPDVLAVERGDEGRVQGIENGAGDPVPLVLDLLEPHPHGRPLRQVGAVGDLGEQGRRGNQVAGVFGEELVEALLLGHEPPDNGIRFHFESPRSDVTNVTDGATAT
jgi:hypothetical protein